MINTAASATNPDYATTFGQRISVALLGLFIGSFLILGAGFAGQSELHNAAHDSRHAFTFPCH